MNHQSQFIKLYAIYALQKLDSSRKNSDWKYSKIWIKVPELANFFVRYKYRKAFATIGSFRDFSVGVIHLVRKQNFPKN